MKICQMLSTAFVAATGALALMTSGAALGGAHEGGGGSESAAGDGHCVYIQENMFAGPFKVCDTPASAAACEELGSTDDNRDAAHGEGDACPAEGVVGTCDMGSSKRLYYEGDPGGLEIGCGFQGGEWSTP